jgi:flagellar hook-associated protein 3 FlgL
MPFRITNNMASARLSSQIASAQQRVANAQEQVATGKRINRPSDDPTGAQRVMQVRTLQASVSKFQGNASAVNDRLLTADSAINSYQQLLDRSRALLTQGASDTTDASTRVNLATELDTLRTQMLSVANLRSDGEYVFGGTRQDAPPFDLLTGTPAASVAVPRRVQIEPSGPAIESGVVAESIFSDVNGSVMDTLAAASAALRGTGNPAADTATMAASLDRIATFTDKSGAVLAHVGANIASVQSTQERLSRDFLALEDTAQRFETADAAGSMVELSQASTALNAILQSGSFMGRKSLIDFLG